MSDRYIMEPLNQKFGRYELLVQLATGGMAEIFLARQSGIEGFERLVVVKKLLPHLKQEKRFLEMFLDEARIAAQLAHPNIVQIYDLGQEQGEYFIAMEFLEGESLGYLVRQALVAEKRLPPELALSITAQVCDGLECAHNLVDHNGVPLRVVHRDVSPQNIIVLFSGGVKLVDFGVAKAASKIHHTKVGTLKGKFAYMSPEQCLGDEVDGRSDLFSLGTVLWEVLTCRRLFKRDQEAAIIHAILNKQIRPPSTYNPAVGPELDALVMRALTRDLQGRFQSAADMAAACREVLRQTGQPAGTREIAEFMKEVFAERARTKHWLLSELRSGRTQKIAISMLKPDTEESLPGNAARSDSKLVEPADQGQEQSESSVEAPTRRMPAPFGEVAAGLQDFSEDREVPTRRDPVGKRQPPPLPTQEGSELATRPLRPPADLVVTSREAEPLPPQAAQLEEEEKLLQQASRAPPVGQAAGPESARRGLWYLLLLAGLVMAGITAMVLSALLGDAKPRDESKEKEPTRESSGVIRPDAGGPVADIPGADSDMLVQAVAVDAGTPPGADASPPPDEKAGEQREDNGNPPSRSSQVTGSGQKTAGRSASDAAGGRTRPRPARNGRLRLDSDPWSEVYLGKRKLGITPLLGVRLPAGKHLLRLVNPPSGKRKTIKVRIRPGRTSKLFVRL